MWIMTTDAFLSVVHKAPCKPDELLVRARVRKHLEDTFPGLPIITSEDTDYRFRVIVKRADLADLMAQQVLSIDYSNFKGAVKETRFHDALMRVWGALAPLQPFGPYGRDKRRARQGGLFADGRGSTPEAHSASERLRGLDTSLRRGF